MIEDVLTMVRIENIHENKASYPGIIYAELREVADNSLIISATLDYIFDALRNPQNNKYNCVNAEKDKWGNFSVRTWQLF